LLWWLSLCVLAACVVMTFVGGWRNGITEDEPFHVQRFDNYVHTGWYLGEGQLDHGRPAAGMTQQYVYGPATMLVLHAVNAVVGVEPWDRAGTSADAYAVRHLGVGVFGVLGLLAVIVTGRVLFRRWDWGVLAGATMAAVPLWTGHAMFNLKDVPVGTGYAWATLGLVLLARDGPSSRRWVRWGTPIVLVCGIVLAVGTRPAMWSGIAFGAVVLLAFRALRREPAGFVERVRADGWVLGDLLVTVVLSWLLLWWMDPKVFHAPLTVLTKSVHSSSDFLGISAPWGAVPLWVSMQVPVLVLVLALVGSVVVVRSAVAARFRLGAVGIGWLLVGAQAFAMPVGVMLTRSPVYGDLRQLLFSVPATALLATLGMSRVLAGADRADDARVGTMARALVAGGIVVPVLMQGMLFPYNYTFYNPLAVVAGLTTSGEYYRASGRELAPDVPLHGRMVCQPEGDEKGRALREAHLNGWMDCRSDIASPIAAFRQDFAGVSTPIAQDEFWAITFQPKIQTAPNCRRVTSVSRRTLWQHLQMATLVRCSLAFPTLPAGTVEFRETNELAVLLPDLGWLLPSVDQSGYGIRTHGVRSTLVFRLPASMRGTPATLVLRTTEPARPEVSFGGVALQPRPLPSGAGFSVTIPSDLVDLAVARPQELALSAGRSGDFPMKLLSIELARG